LSRIGVSKITPRTLHRSKQAEGKSKNQFSHTLLILIVFIFKILSHYQIRVSGTTNRTTTVAL
jgi:hypothetical protein